MKPICGPDDKALAAAAAALCGSNCGCSRGSDHETGRKGFAPDIPQVETPLFGPTGSNAEPQEGVSVTGDGQV